MKPIIKVENLSKQYRIGAREASYDTFRESLVGAVKAPFQRLRRNGSTDEDTIWALKDVNFEVQPGEVVGIIGRNGAGKSTLLKVLSRITEPTTGSAKLYGRVASLLEVGTGFHPELTGRENIYLNGAVLGMRRQEIERKFDEIVSFAEVEKFIDTPVKRYSSGMYLRLAFAVAAHLEPEILVVDEVLAVGDAAFQKKCLGKMGKVAEEGRTVLFVSHNMAAMQRLCATALVLEQGSVRLYGEAKKIIQSYLADATRNDADQTFRTRRTLSDQEMNGPAYFTSWFLNSHKDEAYSVVSGSDIELHLKVEVKRPLHNILFGIALWPEDGTLVWAGSNYDGGGNGAMLERGTYTVTFLLKQLAVRPGNYAIEVSINSLDGQLDRWYASPGLEVLPRRSTALSPSWQGLLDLEYVFTLNVAHN